MTSDNHAETRQRAQGGKRQAPAESGLSRGAERRLAPGGHSALVTVAWRNIWRNRRRTILCVVAIAIAVFFNVFMQAWMDGMYDGIERVVRIYDTGHVLATSSRFEEEREYLPVQYPLSDGRDASELVALAESLEGVRAAVPRISAYATLFDSVIKHARLWGVDIARERAVNDLNLTKRNDGLVEGRFPEPGTNECAIGRAMAKKGGFSIGDAIPLKTVSAQFSDKYWNPKITGIFEFDYRPFDEDTIIVPIDRLRRVLALGEGIQQLVVFAHDARDSTAVRNALRERLGDGATVREWTDNYWVAMMRSMTGMMLVVYGVFIVVASFLIVNTMLMVIHERIKEIGMMGSLGMSRREIVETFFLEALFLSLLGSAVGAVFGGGASFVGSLFPIDMNTFTGGGMKDLPVSGTIFLSFSPLKVVFGFAFGVAVSSLCTILPSLKSAFIEPVEALRR